MNLTQLANGIAAADVAAALVLDFMYIKPRRGLFYAGETQSAIPIPQATIEEQHMDEMEITEHPVQQGADIADHAFKRAAELVINCAWSNSPSSALGIFESSPWDLNTIYYGLLNLQESRILVDIYTGKRKYTDMLLRVISANTDYKTENSLVVSLHCKQIIIVNTQSVSVDPSVMATPQSTSSPTQKGAKSLNNSVPSYVQPGY